MYILLHRLDGRLQEAMAMRLGKNSMRLFIPGEDDTVELTLQDGQWVSERNEALEIAFLSMTAEEEWNRRLYEREAVA